ncbi:MAG: YtxH domain-containing protein [Gammaproteobacteria bacterium]
MTTHKETSGLGLGSLVIGAIAGAIAGILFAPKSGKETRDDLKETLTEIKDQVAIKVSDLKDITEQGYRAAVDTVLKTYEDARKLTSAEVNSIKSDLNKGYKDIKKAADQGPKKSGEYMTQ